MDIQEFPVGGPREPVYAALRSRQFKQSNWSDKHWSRLDGVAADIYGAGSKLRVCKGEKEIADLPMAEALAAIDAMDANSSDTRTTALVD
jgi:hypothetical protein